MFATDFSFSPPFASKSFVAATLLPSNESKVLTAQGTALRRCLVMALPLGVVRLGRYAKSPELTLEANACGVDASL